MNISIWSFSSPPAHFNRFFRPGPQCLITVLYSSELFPSPNFVLPLASSYALSTELIQRLCCWHLSRGPKLALLYFSWFPQSLYPAIDSIRYAEPLPCRKLALTQSATWAWYQFPFASSFCVLPRIGTLCFNELKQEKAPHPRPAIQVTLNKSPIQTGS
jgi:hypothetical protein